MTIKKVSLVVFILIFSIPSKASDFHGLFLNFDRKNPFGLKYRSAIGPVLGFERGRYTFLTLGLEGYKTEGFLKPRRFTIGIEAGYNIRNNVISYKLYSFYKRGRFGLTYGGGITYISDFEFSRIGISPQVGYKLLNFHFYTGANIMFGPKNLQEFNKIFVGINFFIPAKNNVFKKK